MREWRSWLPMVLIAVIVPFGWLYPLLRGAKRLLGSPEKPAFQPVFIRRRRS